MKSNVDNDTKVIVASALSALGAAALVLFAADLSARMRDTGSSLLASVAFGGAIICAAGVRVDAALRSHGPGQPSRPRASLGADSDAATDRDD